MSKPRVNLRISHKLYAELEGRAEKPGVTKTQIVEAALQQYFEGVNQDAGPSRVVSDLRHAVSESHRDIRLINEMLAQFILYWLTRIEPLPEDKREEAHELGQRRFEHFLGQLNSKLR